MTVMWRHNNNRVKFVGKFSALKLAYSWCSVTFDSNDWLYSDSYKLGEGLLDEDDLVLAYFYFINQEDAALFVLTWCNI